MTRITRKPQSSKTHKAPKRLSIEADGLFALMCRHCDSDGQYSWGVTKTAEYYGISRRKVRQAYDELARKHQIELTQSGKDLKTGKMLLLKARPLRAGISPGVSEPSPCARVPMQLNPLEPSMCTGAPHTVKGLSTVSRPVSIESSSYMTVGGMSTRAHGLRARLDEERSELSLWENALRSQTNKPKYAANAAACRQRIADFEAQLMGSEQSAPTTGDSSREAGSREQ
jgi:hypothetical protein